MIRLLLVLLLACLLFPAPTFSKATFTVINVDGPGEGFNNTTTFTPVGGNHGTTLGQARLIAFQYAADLLGECLNSIVPIVVEARMDPLTCTPTGAVLGTGTSKTKHRNFPFAPILDTWYPQAMANSFAGADLAPSDSDIEVVFNSSLIGSPACAGGANWYYGLDGNTPSGDFDFVTVVLHELTHGSGFQTYVSLSTGALFMGFNDHYMLWMESHFAAPSGYPFMINAQRLGGHTADPNLHWTGPSVTAAQVNLTGGMSNGHVRLHGPSTPQPGASLNHFSPSHFPSGIMEPNYTGAKHDLGVALNVFDDAGWSVANKTWNICDGSSIAEIDDDLGLPPLNLGAAGTGQTRGMFFTALKDFALCGVAIKAEHVQGQWITAELFEANGSVRGAHVETNVMYVGQSAEQFHMVSMPNGHVLQECQDYELIFTLGSVTGLPFWDINLAPDFPFNANGLFRVYDASDGSGIPSPDLPHMALVGSPAVNPTKKLELTEPAITWTTCLDDSRAHGVFVRAEQMVSVCAVAFQAKFDGWHLGKTVRVNIYQALGFSRGLKVATGTTVVTQLGLVNHTIPVNAVLHEGYDYDIEVEYPQRTTFACWLEGPIPLPFSVGGVLTVVDGETDGNPTATDYLLPRITVEYEELAGGEPHDLVGTIHHEAPTIITNTFSDMGVYALALNDVPVTSLGWMADVPAGQIMEMRIYQGSGKTRGALVASSPIFSTGSGMRWHDAELTANLQVGDEYNISVLFQNVNDFPVYDENFGTAPTPYTAQGLLEILDAEEGGSASATTDLIHIRLNYCKSTTIGVPEESGVTPTAWLGAPRPNPVRGSSVLSYSLDAAGPVTIRLFDVRGRLVSTLLDGDLPAGEGQVAIHGAELSAGLYFARFQTPQHSFSQRVVVLH